VPAIVTPVNERDIQTDSGVDWVPDPRESTLVQRTPPNSGTQKLIKKYETDRVHGETRIPLPTSIAPNRDRMEGSFARVAPVPGSSVYGNIYTPAAMIRRTRLGSCFRAQMEDRDIEVAEGAGSLHDFGADYPGVDDDTEAEFNLPDREDRDSEGDIEGEREGESDSGSSDFDSDQEKTMVVEDTETVIEVEEGERATVVEAEVPDDIVIVSGHHTHHTNHTHQTGVSVEDSEAEKEEGVGVDGDVVYSEDDSETEEESEADTVGQTEETVAANALDTVAAADTDPTVDIDEAPVQPRIKREAGQFVTVSGAATTLETADAHMPMLREGGHMVGTVKTEAGTSATEHGISSEESVSVSDLSPSGAFGHLTAVSQEDTHLATLSNPHPVPTEQEGAGLVSAASAAVDGGNNTAARLVPLVPPEGTTTAPGLSDLHSVIEAVNAGSDLYESLEVIMNLVPRDTLPSLASTGTQTAMHSVESTTVVAAEAVTTATATPMPMPATPTQESVREDQVQQLIEELRVTREEHSRELERERAREERERAEEVAAAQRHLNQSVQPLNDALTEMFTEKTAAESLRDETLAQLDTLRTAMQEAVTANEASAAQVAELTASLATAESLQSESETTISSLREELEGSATALTAARAEVVSTQTAREEEVSSHDAERTELMSRLRETESLLATVRQSLETAQDTVTGLQQERDMLTKGKGVVETELVSLQSQLATASDERDRDREVLQTLLDSVSEERDRGREALRSLTEERDSEIETLQETISTLRDSLSVAEAKGRDALAESEAHATSLHSKETELTKSIAAATEVRQQLAEAEASLETVRRELEVALGEVASLHAAREEAQSLYATQTAEVQSLRTQLGTVAAEREEERQARETSLAKLTADLSAAESRKREALSVERELDALRTQLETMSRERESERLDLEGRVTRRTAELEAAVKRERKTLAASQAQITALVTEKDTALDASVAEVQTLSNKVAESVAKVEALTAALTLSRTTSDSMRQQLVAAQGVVAGLEEERDTLTQAKGVVGRECLSLQTQLATASDERDREREALQTRFKTMSQERDSLLDTVAELTADLESARAGVQRLGEERDTLGSEVTALNTRLAAAEIDRATATAGKEEAAARLGVLETERDTLISERDSAQGALASAEGEVTAGREQRDTLTIRVDILATQLAAATTSRDTLTESLATSEGKVAEMERERDAALAEAESVREELASLQTKLDAEQSVYTASRAEIETLQSDMASAEEEREGEREPREREVQDASQTLLTAHEAIAARASALSDQLVEAQRHSEGVRQELLAAQAAVTSLTKERERQAGTLSDLTTRLKAAGEERDSLSYQLVSLRTSRETDLATHTTTVAALHRRLSNAGATLATVTANKEAAEARLGVLEIERDTLIGERDTLIGERESAHQAVASARREVTADRDQIDTLTESLAASEDKVAELERERAEAVSETETVREALAELQCQATALHHNKDTIASERDSLKAKVRDLAGALETATLQGRESLVEANALQAQIDTLTEQRDTLTRHLTEATAAQATLQTQVESLEAALSECHSVPLRTEGETQTHLSLFGLSERGTQSDCVMAEGEADGEIGTDSDAGTDGGAAAECVVSPVEDEDDTYTESERGDECGAEAQDSDLRREWGRLIAEYTPEEAYALLHERCMATLQEVTGHSASLPQSRPPAIPAAASSLPRSTPAHLHVQTVSAGTSYSPPPAGGGALSHTTWLPITLDTAPSPHVKIDALNEDRDVMTAHSNDLAAEEGVGGEGEAGSVGEMERDPGTETETQTESVIEARPLAVSTATSPMPPSTPVLTVSTATAYSPEPQGDPALSPLPATTLHTEWTEADTEAVTEADTTSTVDRASSLVMTRDVSLPTGVERGAATSLSVTVPLGTLTSPALSSVLDAVDVDVSDPAVESDAQPPEMDVEDEEMEGLPYDPDLDTAVTVLDVDAEEVTEGEAEADTADADEMEDGEETESLDDDPVSDRDLSESESESESHEESEPTDTAALPLYASTFEEVHDGDGDAVDRANELTQTYTLRLGTAMHIPVPPELATGTEAPVTPAEYTSDLIESHYASDGGGRGPGWEALAQISAKIVRFWKRSKNRRRVLTLVVTCVSNVPGEHVVKRAEVVHVGIGKATLNSQFESGQNILGHHVFEIVGRMMRHPDGINVFDADDVRFGYMTPEEVLPYTTAGVKNLRCRFRNRSPGVFYLLRIRYSDNGAREIVNFLVHTVATSVGAVTGDRGAAQYIVSAVFSDIKYTDPHTMRVVLLPCPEGHPVAGFFSEETTVTLVPPTGHPGVRAAEGEVHPALPEGIRLLEDLQEPYYQDLFPDLHGDLVISSRAFMDRLPASLVVEPHTGRICVEHCAGLVLRTDA
ncbi:hypothetical protein KIPB_005146, partial [Kipferlia bialata]